MNNKYFDNSTGSWNAIDVYQPPILNRGKDFYIDIFRIIEEQGKLRGLVFYLSEVIPETLPVLNATVVLVAVADERYRYKPYFLRILCILRCYGRFPQYREWFPKSGQALLSLLQFTQKVAVTASDIARCLVQTRSLHYLVVYRKVLHIPLSCFFKFEHKPKAIKDRTIDYAFLGSTNYSPEHTLWLHKWLAPPKLVSRAEMVRQMNAYSATSGATACLRKTGDFEESILNSEIYVKTLQNCKISICPRGSHYETYRFFESMKAGCIVVCEQLPESEFYQGNPAILLKRWSELPTILDRLLEDPDRMEELSLAGSAYWSDKLSEIAIAREMTIFMQRL